ncbi:MAG: MaoC family dehydratase [Desulfotomaculales bacterium]|jgi:acyl dehydratase
MLDKYFDELEIGTAFRSRCRTVTETDLVLFSAFSGDWYPLHTDKEYASRTPFGQRIAHGMLVLSVASGLIPIAPGVVVAFYGMEKVRFTAPVFIGDTIHVETEVLEKKEKGPDMGVATIRQDVVNQRGEKVCTAVLKVLLNKKKPGVS